MMNIPQRIGNYRVEKPIGRGGSSQVLLARHAVLQERTVAIKLLLSQDEDSVERFIREANIASRLHHPHIVQVYDHGLQQPFHYTIMEYVNGGSLRNLMQGKSLPLELVLHVFRLAGQALDYAHTNGIVHRDVSPGNILIEQSTQRVLLADFGIARETSKAGVTSIGNIMGTPGYLSPEHAMSATAVTHLSDIFGLGVVLFESLTGSLPWDHFPGMPPDHNGGGFTPPKTLRERGSDLPNDVDRVIQTMLSIEPAKRYPTAQAAIDDLDRVLQRHSSPTVVVGAIPVNTAQVAGRTGPRPINLVAPEVAPHPLERALALDLLKGPLQESRRHSEAMNDPQEIALLMDQWSAKGRLRLRALGRQANIRRLQTTNVYFYTMQVLLETRSPAAEIEEPDYKAAQIKLEKEIDRWGVVLPQPAGFKAENGGTVRLPGSMRVTPCSACNALGRTICPRCNGRGRVNRPVEATAVNTGRGTAANPTVTGTTANPAQPVYGTAATMVPGMASAAAPAIIACPECSGSGGLQCKRCDGVGRMLQHKATTWSRKATSYNGQDDLQRIDEQGLLEHCRPREVYSEQASDGFRSEWQHVPVLAELIKRAQTGLTSDIRVVRSEVQISFIPVTEVVFDLDPPPTAPPTANNVKAKPRRQGEVYSRYIYGFERYMPGDWTLLNWERVWVLLLLTGLLVALIFNAILLARMRLPF